MLNRFEHDQLEHPSPTVLQQVAEALELDSHDLFAFVGYHPSDNLPGLAPYLRAKYQLPPAALAEASKALRDILAKYDGFREPAPSVRWQAASHASNDQS